ncbi:formylglycine-generating enzyme family protein [Engelhardtia mirabilis]
MGLLGVAIAGQAPMDGAGGGFATRIPGTTVDLAMVPIANPAPAGEARGEEPAFWISATEVTWDMFDAFVFEQLEAELPEGVDAMSRPTKPYITADRGFGHDGYPVGSVSLRAARGFCEWLTLHTGRKWRLPTAGEWTHAALGGARGPWHHGSSAEGLEAVAWFKDNARRKTHPVAGLAPNGFGLYDVHGNVAEWVETEDGAGQLMGGAYLDRAADLAVMAAKTPTSAWNRSDPNLPKSVWWLADGPFAGFRVVCESPPPADDPASDAQTPTDTPQDSTGTSRP